MTKDEVDAIISARKAGHPGPLSRACFDARCGECSLYGCQCKHHYVKPEELRRIMRADGAR